MVKTQNWIVVSVYVLVANVKKQLKLSVSQYEMLQTSGLTMFEGILLDQLLVKTDADTNYGISINQLNLFE